MAKYTFSAEGTISLTCTVEADSLREAKRMVREDAAMMGLCHQCAGGDDGEWCTSGELDCEPVNIRLNDSDDVAALDAKTDTDGSGNV